MAKFHSIHAEDTTVPVRCTGSGPVLSNGMMSESNGTNGKFLHATSRIFCILLLCFQIALITCHPAFAGSSAGGCDSTGNTSCGVTNDNTARSSPDPASAESARQPSVMVGNPINLITGNKYQNDTDIQLSNSRLTWQRHYNSANAPYDFGLGRGWSATFLATLQTVSTKGATLIQSNGRLVLFKPPENLSPDDASKNLVWEAVTPSDGTLYADGEYFDWALPDGRTLKFKGPLLVEIDFPGNAQLTLFYKQNRLVRVTDEYNQQLQFSYYSRDESLPNYDQLQQQQQLLDDQGRPVFGAATARLKTLTRPDGKTIHYNYDAFGNLTRVHYPDNTARTYHYENADYPAYLTGITDRRGIRINTWDYNEQGLAVSSERADGVERTNLQYELPTDGSGIGYTHITNSLGEQTTYTWEQYPEQGQSLLLASEGVGCASCPPVGMTYTYTDDFQLSEARHFSGKSRRWEYDDHGRTTASYQIGTDSSERLINRMKYDVGVSFAGTRPAEVSVRSVNPAGARTTTVTYNTDGQPVAVTEKGFKPILHPHTTTDANSAPTVVDYEPIKRTTSFEYQDGQLIKIDGPRENVEDYTLLSYFDKNSHSKFSGYLSSIQLPSGQRLKFIDYNAFGQPTTIQKNQSTPYQLAYNNNQRLTSITQRGNTLTYHYGAEGRLTGMTDVNGQQTRVNYDEAGRLQYIRGNGRQRIEWIYDTESRKIKEEQFGFDGTEILSLALIYDSLGQLTQQVETRTNYSTGLAVSKQNLINHNETGQITAATNSETGLSTSYDWNPFGELLSYQTPFIRSDNWQNQTHLSTDYQDAAITAATTRFSHDETGNPRTFTDARDNTTTYYRDDFGQLVAEHHPDTGLVIFERDEVGNTIARTDADGETTTTTYDAANRPLTRTSLDGQTSYDYDAITGQMIKATNAATTETFSYSINSQLTRHTREIDNHHFETTYTYDPRGRVTKKGLPDGTQLRYHYYPDILASEDNSQSQSGNSGQLKAITRESLFGLFQETLIGEIDTDPSDGRIGHINHNGIITEKLFYPDGSLQSISSSQGLQLHYKYDDAGRITGIDRNGSIASYQYLNNHLVAVKNNTSTILYRYDELGNRLQMSEFPESDDKSSVRTEYYFYPEKTEGNRLLGKKGSFKREDYSYSASGAAKRTPQFQYIYNRDQRPVQVYKNEKLIAEYSYNGFGERIKKVTYDANGPLTTYFLYDGSRLTAEIKTDGSSQTIESINQTLYLGFTPTVYLTPDHTYSIESDHLGTPQSVTDESAHTVWQAEYSPYGETNIFKQEVTFNHRLPGQYFDKETGTHYNYFRDYDPSTARYLTSDPIGISDGPNKYIYAKNTPLHYSDPLGLFACAGLCIGTVVLGGTVLHYIRNTFNRPVTYQIAESEWIELPAEKAIWHRMGYGNEFNIKFISPDGHSEVVFHEDQTIVTNEANQGTFNYCGPGNWVQDICHVALDVVPYLALGNSPVDFFNLDRITVIFSDHSDPLLADQHQCY